MATLFGVPRAGFALVGDAGDALVLDANLRGTSALSVNYDEPALFGSGNPRDGIGQTLLRGVLEGDPHPQWHYELHLVQATNLSTAGAAGPTLLAAGGTVITPFRAVDATLDSGAGTDVALALWADRLNVTWRAPWFDLTIGRQAITFGKTYFWNILDVFLPFGPNQFDRDYKAGVDAVRVDVPLGAYSGMTLVGALGRSGNGESRWQRSGFLVRGFTHVLGWDGSLQVGKGHNHYHVGAGVSGELWRWLHLRGEAVLRWDQDNTDRVDAQAVVGLGHRFDNSLNLQGAYFFNGPGGRDGLSQRLAQVAMGDALQAQTHYAGLSVSYDLIPLITAQVGWIFGFSDLSQALQPSLVMSVADEVDVVAGAFLAFGDRPSTPGMASSPGLSPLVLESEFGTYPHLLYLETKLYF